MSINIPIQWNAWLIARTTRCFPARVAEINCLHMFADTFLLRTGYVAVPGNREQMVSRAAVMMESFKRPRVRKRKRSRAVTRQSGGGCGRAMGVSYSRTNCSRASVWMSPSSTESSESPKGPSDAVSSSDERKSVPKVISAPLGGSSPRELLVLEKLLAEGCAGNRE